MTTEELAAALTIQACHRAGCEDCTALRAAAARLRALETVAEHATGRCDCKRVDDCHVAIHKALGRTE